MNPVILFEDKHIIVCIKPPGIPAQPDPTGSESLLEMLQKQPLNQQHTIGLVHRLDRPVGGVMVFARNREALAHLNRQIQTRQLSKSYLAVVCGSHHPSEGTCTDWLLKNARTNASSIVAPNTRDAKEAILHYRSLGTAHTEEDGPLTLLQVELETGRHHQIRVQLAGAGMPIWGDTKYNPAFARRRGWFSIALWAYRLGFAHPATQKPLVFSRWPSEFPFNLFTDSESRHI